MADFNAMKSSSQRGRPKGGTRIVWALASILAAIFCARIFYCAIESWVVNVRQVPFDSDKWKTSIEIRQAMLRDLLTNVLPGLEREQIELSPGRIRNALRDEALCRCRFQPYLRGDDRQTMAVSSQDRNWTLFR